MIAFRMRVRLAGLSPHDTVRTMEPKKTFFYQRFHHPFVLSPEGTLRYDTTKRVAFGPFMRGIEIRKTIRGELVTVVRLEDGTEEPITQLIVSEDRRQHPRPAWYDDLTSRWNG